MMGRKPFARVNRAEIKKATDRWLSFLLDFWSAGAHACGFDSQIDNVGGDFGNRLDTLMRAICQGRQTRDNLIADLWRVAGLSEIKWTAGALACERLASSPTPLSVKRLHSAL